MTYYNPSITINTSGCNWTSTTIAPASSYATIPSGCTESHWADSVVIEDGEAVAYCSFCTARVVVPRVPGGITVLRVREMLERLAAGDFAGELFAEFSELKHGLEADREALELAEAMLAPAETLLAQRGLFL